MTCLYVPDVQSIGSITYTTAASGTEVTLNVPANLIQRAFQYNFDVAGLVTTLSQSDLDSSTTYLVGARIYEMLVIAAELDLHLLIRKYTLD